MMPRPRSVRARSWFPVLLGLLLLCSSLPARSDRPQVAPERLIEEVRAFYGTLPPDVGFEAPSEAVITALRKVPRPLFVPESQRDKAWENRPLPIGHGQTISQPNVVALMTDLLQIEPGDRVLEVGTGSGYQAAILAEVGAEVYSIEIVEELARSARERLRELGRCPPWRAKRRRVVPGSREATRDTRRAEGAKGDPKGASERGVQSYGRPVCSRNELAMLWRNAG